MDVEEVHGGQQDIHQAIIDHRRENEQAHARILEEQRDTRTQISELGGYRSMDIMRYTE
jgi:hypothetical protein